MSLEICVDLYFDWLIEHGYSEWTIVHRRGYLNFFLRWCDDRGISDPTELTRLVIERYQKSTAHAIKRDGEPLSFHGQSLRLAAVKALCSWMAKQRHILYNPAAEIELPKLPQRLPRRVFSPSEMEDLINFPDTKTSLGLRDRAILEIFYSCGIRRGEMIKLSIYDIDFERGTLMVRQGKNKKDRLLPIGERALLWTRKYLDEVRPSLAISPDDGVMFLTKYGKAFTPNGMSTLVKRLLEKAGFGKVGSCHMIRHSMATVMLDEGADIRHVQLMLGHASIKTTEIYTHVALRALKAVHEATHPSAKLKRDDGSEEAQ